MYNFLSSVSYSVLANLCSVIGSALLILVLPKLMTLEDYGAWQLFIFYFSYIGFLHFGWLDGIYLRYGGCDYQKLSKDVFSGQFIALLMLLIFEVICINIFLLISNISNIFIIFSLRTVSIALVFMNLIWFSSYVLQLSSRIKDYAKLIILQKFVTAILTVVVVMLGYRDYKTVSFVTIISTFFAMIYGIYSIRELLFNRKWKILLTVKEAWENLRVGSKLMLANIASMLILGIVRYGISVGWDVITFGKISLTLNVSSFIMVFINATSVVLFPLLKRIDESKYAQIYFYSRNVLSFFLLGLLISYYPLRLVLEKWLPQYGDSLLFMGFLFPMCVFESKTNLLVATFLKSFRKEALLLKINIFSVLFAVVTTYVSVFAMHNLQIALISIVLNFAFKMIISEIFVERLFGLKLSLERLEELCLVVSFMLLNYWNWKLGFFVYSVLYLYHIYRKKDFILKTINMRHNNQFI